jgi:nucleoid-associated protein YgaU
MRTLKLLACSAVLAALALVPTAHASDDAIAAEDAALPVDPIETPAAGDVVRAAEPAPVLGQIGYDSQGRPGRIHIVVPGDTLWDISDAYLGTPWVWPSIWTDNRDIENPHLIHPGDHIWISDSEMRVVSPAEVEAMLSARPAPPEEFPAAAPELVETVPVELPMDVVTVPEEQGSRRVSVREWVGLISARELEAAASIVREVPEHVMSRSVTSSRSFAPTRRSWIRNRVDSSVITW